MVVFLLQILCRRNHICRGLFARSQHCLSGPQTGEHPVEQTWSVSVYVHVLYMYVHWATTSKFPVSRPACHVMHVIYGQEEVHMMPTNLLEQASSPIELYRAGYIARHSHFVPR